MVNFQLFSFPGRADQRLVSGFSCRMVHVLAICLLGSHAVLSSAWSEAIDKQSTAAGISYSHGGFITAQGPSLDTRGSTQGEHFPLLIEATLEDLMAGLESGHFTSVDLVNAYIARIREVNSTLKAVTELNPDALAIAAELDAARVRGTCLGPLHGIPILIKNNIATADKMDTTASSYALLGARPPEDSTMAAKLRKAGAIILGKTNLSQWANYRSYNTSNGWSAQGGQTQAAYYPNQDPSGSSSGSGVASSLGLALACLGTETDGSIVSPSDANNLVGIKPTVGLTSRYLVIPISEHQDTIGPMARSVKDAAYILSAIAGADSKDNYTSAIPFTKVPDYVSACKHDGLKGRRIGVPRNIIDLRGAEELSPIIPVFNAALDALRAAGATVIDNITLPGYEYLAAGDYENVVLELDFVTDLWKEYLSKLTTNPQNITSLADLQAYTHADPREDWPQRDTLIWEAALNLTKTLTKGSGNDSPEFWGNHTAQVYYAGPLGITGALRNYSLDALVVPTAFASTMPARIGSPIITVPLGKFPNDTAVVKNGFGNLVATAPNVPFGMSFMGAHFSEEKLVGMAYAFEQRTKVRDAIKPYIQPTTELKDVVKKTCGINN
ncbi:putative glutamyl-tRNA amidotransferase subunit A [Diplogelasinospora grovesii]|uniref:Glutamyl-tRNA amidotransferase subunit A n=1 Tax=Diplogelasinospora grovesii TaxID=303347 RepID=A0AAN6NGM8_9PEZI|nr:putative glutamyl-tRNA amidotransferase subunit A [Diplogelasinospora grovesii]